MKQAIIVFCLLSMVGFASATIINVPGSYPTIQAGVDAAAYGDTILVAPGLYVENVQLTGGVHAENLTLMGSGMDDTAIDGGGLFNVIYAYQISNITIEEFTIQNAQQSGSAPGNVGIHFNPQSSAGTKIVRNCHVKNNGHGIHIWNDFGGVAYIEHNIISENLYDGFDPYLGTVYLTNNTIVNNDRDGYHDWSGGGSIYIKNNIIAFNGRYGIYKHLNTPVFISYNDVYANVEGAYYQGYSGPPEPFIPNPGTGEIAADPLFVGAPSNYNLSWINFPVPDLTMSPCIDSGDPGSPPDPDGTTADMGALYFNQSVPLIELSADSLLFPDTNTGESSSLPLTIYNVGTVDLILYDITISLPDVFSMDWLPTDSLITPGDSLIVEVSFTPLDTLLYNDNLTIENNDVRKRVYLEGQGLPPLSVASEKENIPGEFALHSAYPNPFNSTTTVSFALPQAERVNLKVYSPTGTLVATLVNGWRDAGIHEVTFDGQDLPSGIYVASLNTEKTKNSIKLVLIK